MTNIKGLLFVLKGMWAIRKKYFLLVIPTAILPVINNLFQVIMPGYIVEYLIRDSRNQALIMVFIFIVVITVSQLLVSVFAKKRTVLLTQHNYYLSENLIKSSTKSTYQEFESFDFRQRYFFAQQCISEGYVEKALNAVVDIMSNIILLVPLFYIISYITWWLWIAMSASVAIYTFSEKMRSKYIFEMFQKSSSDDYHMLYARDALTNRSFAKEVRLFNMFNYVSVVAERFINALAEIQKKQANKTFRIYFFSYLYNTFFVAAVFVYIAYQCVYGIYNVADFVMLSLVVLSVSDTAVKIATSVVAVQTASLFVNHYATIVNAKQPDEEFSSHPIITKSSVIKCKNISFTYPEGAMPAINNISESFKCGNVYGLVGESGSGKTTFTKLLMRLYTADGGDITLDDTNTKDYSASDWQDLFSPVFQDYNIYGFTISDNIIFGGDMDVDSIFKATKINISGIDNFIGSEYGDNGIELSGGEQQKLAFLRAIAKNSPIFILDEPTASLSPQSEREFYKIVDSTIKDKTVFLISHRLASCNFCDEILVFDAGQVIERGTHLELLKKKGKYYDMFTAQASLYSTEQ
jgi:ABC-type multidrug transport system fused ATPase/permease subunit